jgi:nicotinamidase-related amidase/glutathione S-transferase/alkylated DNA repair dioxygenase AlkB
MFKINGNDLPIVRTRQALLVLNLQNDFVTPGGVLAAENSLNLVENVVNLAEQFRDSGNDVVWIQTVFETSRPVNSLEGESENVITDRELLKAPGRIGTGSATRSRPSDKLLERFSKMAEASGLEMDPSASLLDEVDEEEQGEPVSETFLTVEPGQRTQVALPGSPGADLSPLACQNVDNARDLVFQKSHYSAFKDGTLVQTLRFKFVTEIYLCGALTNISIFATAMDAARYGYSITIIDDCLGYRNKARHDEALRQLTEFTGCDIMSSKDVIRDLQRRTSAQQTPPRDAREKATSLESLMANMNLSRKSSSSSRRSKPVPTGSQAPATVAETGRTSKSRPSKEPHIDEDSKLPERHEASGKKPERVKTKVKSRRRHSKGVPQDVAAAAAAESGEPSGGSKGHKSPSSATPQTASQALEKIPTKDKAEAVDAARISNLPERIEAGPSHPENANKAKLESGKEDHQGKSNAKASTVQESAPMCEGDTTVITNLLGDDLLEGIFERVRDEVQWQKMSHQSGEVPRLVAVQGEVAEDGSVPIYRHPADESPPLLPFSPVVSLIRKEVEKKLGHPVNHALIQFYRSGTDYISEHSDKTLDICPNTFVANVSLGAQRTLVFRTKKQLKSDNVADGAEAVEPRKACRAPLPHNSMCKMGLITNMRWLHGIRQDKRMASEKSKAELAYNGGRISLTFRMIGTFLDKDQRKIWGQGATAKSKDHAKTVINGDTCEAEKMIRAFGKENHSTEFDWAEVYGEGFDVLHMTNSPKLFLSGDTIADSRVKILLAEYGISWTEERQSPSCNRNDGSSSVEASATPERPTVKFMDNDVDKSTVSGDVAIILYLDSVYGPKANKTASSQVNLARQFTRLQQVCKLQLKWHAIPPNPDAFKRELELWEAFVAEEPFMAGSAISLADYALIPILMESSDEWAGKPEFPKLSAYFSRMKELDSVMKVFGSGGLDQKAK